MPTKDIISKRLLKRLLVDFGTQLFKLDIVEADLLSNEQPRIEGKRADLVARVKNANGISYILHIEVQNDNRVDVPLRMLRYYTDLALEHMGEEIRQYLLYIGKAPLTMPDHVQTPSWRYNYVVLDIRRVSSKNFLNSHNPDALVLAILCDPEGLNANALVVHIIKELRRLHGAKLDSLRDSLMMLDILAGNRDLQNIVKKNAEMLIDVEKLGIYQLVKEKGEARGLEKGLAQGLKKGKAEGLEKGKAEGLEKGKAEGLEKGKAEGLEKGKAEGLEEGQQKIILKLLSKLPPDQVANLSGVPLAKVQAIASDHKPQ